MSNLAYRHEKAREDCGVHPSAPDATLLHSAMAIIPKRCIPRCDSAAIAGEEKKGSKFDRGGKRPAGEKGKNTDRYPIASGVTDRTECEVLLT